MSEGRIAARDATAGLPSPLVVASIVATAFFMESFDSTVIVMAFPMMATSFGTTPVALGIGLTSYILALAIMIPASGWIADRYGARNVFCAAVALFTITSMLCGFSRSLPEFIVWRACQGAAGALMSPVGRLVVLRSVDKKGLVRAMNFITAPGLIGLLLGPPVGGFITTFADWRWIFFLNVPVGVIGIALARRFIPAVDNPPRRSFDLVGFCLNSIALASLLLGLDLVGRPGNDRWVGLLLSALGMGMGQIVNAHYRRIAHPLVDLSALRIKTFVIATLLGGSLFRIAIAAPIFVLPLFLQVGLGKSAFVAGLLVLAHSAGDLGMKLITTVTLQRLGFKVALISSAALFGALIGALALVDEKTPTAVLLVILLTAGMMRSLQMTGLSSLQFADVPPDQMTGASTYASVNQNVMRAVGITLAAIIISVAIDLRGSGVDHATIPDFHIAFIAAGLASFAAMLRYFSLPANAGHQLRDG